MLLQTLKPVIINAKKIAMREVLKHNSKTTQQNELSFYISIFQPFSNIFLKIIN